MNKNLMNQFQNELTDEAAPVGTEPDAIYEIKELIERFDRVFDVIRQNQDMLFSRHRAQGPVKRILDIEEVIEMFKALYGFDCLQMSLRQVAKKHRVSFSLVNLYKNRILNILKNDESVKALRS